MENLSAVTALAAGPEDGQFVPSAAEIAARAWVLRGHGAALHAIEAEGRPVGLALVYELDELPACYTKAGFVDSGYVDPALPQYVNMVYRFEGSSERSSIAAPDLT